MIGPERNRMCGLNNIKENLKGMSVKSLIMTTCYLLNGIEKKWSPLYHLDMEMLAFVKLNLNRIVFKARCWFVSFQSLSQKNKQLMKEKRKLLLINKTDIEKLQTEKVCEFIPSTVRILCIFRDNYWCTY